MSKKVLVLSSSPRKGGNSDLLCDVFMNGLKETAHEGEKIFLKEKNIAPCIACDYCQRNKGKCVQLDDVTEIIEKIMAADTIVLASPVYFYNVSAQIKMVFDRCYSVFKSVRNKEFVFIYTAEGTQAESYERVYESFKGYTDCFSNSTIIESISGLGVNARGDISKNIVIMDQTYQTAKSL